MKKTIRITSSILGIGLMLVLVLSSCKKETSPADTDFFLGKYTGHITYLNTNEDEGSGADVENGKVNVVKVGKRYDFIFSDGIPNITNVTFEKKGENSVISVGSDESHYIKVDADKLKILYHTDGKTWTANCTRD